MEDGPKLDFKHYYKSQFPDDDDDLDPLCNEDAHHGFIDQEEMEIEGVTPMLNGIANALVWDRNDVLVRIIRDARIVDYLHDLGCRFPSSLLMKWAIFFRAPRCVEAVISGATGIRVNVDATMNEIDPSPVYRAIDMFSPDILNLLLKYGARLDLPCKSTYHTFYLMLPMEAALSSCREEISWTPTESVYELIFTLCSTHKLKQGLCIISQLMRALPVEQMQKAIYQNAREGKIVELTILLYADAVSELGIFDGLEDKYLGLRPEMGSVPIIEKKPVMMSLLLLLEIFKNTDFSMLGFSVVRGVLEKRIKKAGFELTNLQNSDNLDEAAEVVKCIKRTVDHPCGVADRRMLENRSNNATNLQDLHQPMVIWPLGIFGRRAGMEIGQQRTVFALNFHAKRSISYYSGPIIVATHCTALEADANHKWRPRFANYSLWRTRTLPALASILRRKLHV